MKISLADWLVAAWVMLCFGVFFSAAANLFTL